MIIYYSLLPIPYSTVQECDATTDAITIYSGVHKKILTHNMLSLFYFYSQTVLHGSPTLSHKKN